MERGRKHDSVANDCCIVRERLFGRSMAFIIITVSLVCCAKNEQIQGHEQGSSNVEAFRSPETERIFVGYVWTTGRYEAADECIDRCEGICVGNRYIRYFCARPCDDDGDCEAGTYCVCADDSRCSGEEFPAGFHGLEYLRPRWSVCYRMKRVREVFGFPPGAETW